MIQQIFLKTKNIYREMLDSTEKPLPLSVSIAPRCQKGDMPRAVNHIARFDEDSTVSSILPPAKAGGWPSSIRLASNSKPRRDLYIV